MPIKILVNPRSDERFASFAEALLTMGVTTCTDLERRLRQRYPDVRVVEGITDGAGFPRWYVYRDGHWVNPDRRGAAERRLPF